MRSSAAALCLSPDARILGAAPAGVRLRQPPAGRPARPRGCRPRGHPAAAPPAPDRVRRHRVSTTATTNAMPGGDSSAGRPATARRVDKPAGATRPSVCPRPRSSRAGVNQPGRTNSYRRRPTSTCQPPDHPLGCHALPTVSAGVSSRNCRRLSQAELPALCPGGDQAFPPPPRPAERRHRPAGLIDQVEAGTEPDRHNTQHPGSTADRADRRRRTPALPRLSRSDRAARSEPAREESSGKEDQPGRE
jgi:hypothetical protein